MKKNSKKTAISAAIGALSSVAFTFGAVGNAYAEAYTLAWGQVSLAISIYDNDLGDWRIADVSDFQTISPLNSSQASANLASIPGSVNTDNITGADTLVAYEGSNPASIADNSVPQLLAPGYHYARSDTMATGGAITGTGEDIPAIVDVWSEMMLSNDDIGRTSANANNITGFDFVLSEGTLFRFDLEGLTNAQSYMTSDVIAPPSSIGSSHSWVLTLTKESDPTGPLSPTVTYCQWSPDGMSGTIGGTNCTENFDNINLQFNTSATTPGSNSGLVTRSGDAQAQTNLTPGHYSFKIAQATEAQGLVNHEVEVPEPATLFLLGSGLLGLFAGRRRLSK